jgi:hypothetical protein
MTRLLTVDGRISGNPIGTLLVALIFLGLFGYPLIRSKTHLGFAKIRALRSEGGIFSQNSLSSAHTLAQKSLRDEFLIISRYIV